MILKKKPSTIRIVLGFIFKHHLDDNDIVTALDVIGNAIVSNKNSIIIGCILIFISAILAFPTPFVTGYILDIAIPKKEILLVLYAGIFMLISLLLRGIFQYSTGMLFFIVNSKIILLIRAKMFNKITHMSFKDIHQLNTGYFMSRIQDDPPRLALLFGDTIVIMVTNILTICVGISMLLYIDAVLTAITAALLIVLLFVMRYYGVKIRNIMSIVSEKNAKTVKSLQENIDIIELSAQYRRRVFPVRRYIKSSFDTFRSFIRLESLENMSGSVLMSISGIIPIILMILCGYYIIYMKMTVGKFVTFMGVSGIIVGPASAVIGFNIELQKVVVGLKRVGEILSLHQDETFEESINELHPHVISFESIDFSYGNRKVIKSVDITLKKGECIGFAGPSGSGKSTLGKIIAGLYPARYSVRVNLQKVNAMKFQPFMQKIAIVIDQETQLFSGTVRENLLLGKVDATDSDLLQVLKKAQADSFIMELPDGMNTYVGENGSMFSVGQKQRIAIARALLADPYILVVDESTANIDNLTEKKILSILKELSKNMIIIVIAHKLEALTDLDTIYWIEEGQIVLHGTHDELLKQAGAYANQYKRLIVSESNKP